MYNSENGVKYFRVNVFLCRLTLDAMFPPPVRFCPKGLHYYK
jgi:hypothetical protein